jgi:hypothetical protein
MMNLRAQMEDNQQPIDSARRPDQSIGCTVALCFWCVFTFVTQNWVSLNMARQNGIFLQGTNCDNYHQFELSKIDWSETARKLLWSKTEAIRTINHTSDDQGRKSWYTWLITVICPILACKQMDNFELQARQFQPYLHGTSTRIYVCFPFGRLFSRSIW